MLSIFYRQYENGYIKLGDTRARFECQPLAVWLTRPVYEANSYRELAYFDLRPQIDIYLFFPKKIHKETQLPNLVSNWHPFYSLRDSNRVLNTNLSIIFFLTVNFPSHLQ